MASKMFTLQTSFAGSEDAVGAAEGPAVGGPVGPAVGASVGPAVGGPVGPAVGISEGTVVGGPVMQTVGGAVGWVAGVVVGGRGSGLGGGPERRRRMRHPYSCIPQCPWTGYSPKPIRYPAWHSLSSLQMLEPAYPPALLKHRKASPFPTLTFHSNHIYLIPGSGPSPRNIDRQGHPHP